MSVIVGVIFYIIQCILLWKLFEKANVKGWKGLVPIYNDYMCCKLSNCINLFYVKIILFVLFIGSLFGSVASLMVLSVGALNKNGYFYITFFFILSLILFIVLLIIEAITIFKFVSCYTDNITIKVLAVMGAFTVITRLIIYAVLAFMKMYKFNPKD